ncbi:MAG: hypothetical protein IH881_20360 [Myxococcales bacterium]|nr:hypothetical protein [Myxococcales bacterium]
MDYAEGKPIDKDLDTIKFSAQRAADVIADLLALTRRGQYKMVLMDMNALLNDYFSSAEYDAAKRIHPEVTTDIQLSDDRLLFKGSKAHLPKIIMNLVNNAFESMSEGGVLSISTTIIDVEDDGVLNDQLIPRGRYNLLTIEDQGEGIPEENISKIFDPFFSTKGPGRGLGLTTALGIIRGHHGTLRVDCTSGIGTSIRILLPSISAAHPPNFRGKP